MFCLVACLACVLFPAWGLADDADTARRALRRSPVVDAFEKTRDAVVNIACIQIVEDTPGPGSFFSPFFDFRSPLGRHGRKRQVTSVGSGFVVHPDGYVVTNAHVVLKTVDQHVLFADGSEYKARPVAIDTKSDLAVLKIDTDGPLPFSPWAGATIS